MIAGYKSSDESVIPPNVYVHHIHPCRSIFPQKISCIHLRNHKRHDHHTCHQCSHPRFPAPLHTRRRILIVHRLRRHTTPLPHMIRRNANDLCHATHRCLFRHSSNKNRDRPRDVYIVPSEVVNVGIVVPGFLCGAHAEESARAEASWYVDARGSGIASGVCKVCCTG
jgi:hypothetical protein